MAAPGKRMFPEKLSRGRHRAALRKAKRQKRRQELARLRDSGLSQQEEEDASVEEQRLEEKLLETERQKLHEAWLLREQKAQEEFRRRKEREAAASKWQEQRERKLRAEREEQQRRQREEEERRLREKSPGEAAAHRPLGRAGAGAGAGAGPGPGGRGAAWRDPEPPADPRATGRGRADCPFYSKTGACRFGDRCSRRHNLPSSSPTLLIKSMFTTFGLEQRRRDDYDPDASLEDSDEETYQHFLDFYHDVLPELRHVGTVVQFKVSCNLEPHLRGNVYVQYQSEEECRAALALFHGRWYAGRRLQCELCPVTRWNAAICGLSELRQCPRGKRCNFLHVFRNPNDEFRQARAHGRPPPRREDHARPPRRRSPGPARPCRRHRGADRKRGSRGRGEESRRRLSRSRAPPGSPRRGRKRGRGRSSSGSRSRGRRRSGSRGRTTQGPKGK
ncbi:LOW QUALITY PROTEIN: putative U2 small nuclear ribonucleoprotein auxiliary factor 35 kDa subunit-related protein 1 [Vulpes lagopus]|uniref:LOW QUALITY PROTEIN: putative U2 small nuclear ribonucleoprotein auxiliary factor 35 kDa subunit-related protein 1 n=1 Tax=Vulpes lagopus TaxID=494514 RepID=UPI001BC90E64|nr:LOW QUALITY PROTEIN: putative U2 small nuclear ribonucleoprotein auxiliary factor 35 kDa subunit-related protein 1 [Vulpes lagopus]